jgi:hypothetical protein
VADDPQHHREPQARPADVPKIEVLLGSVTTVFQTVIAKRNDDRGSIESNLWRGRRARWSGIRRSTDKVCSLGKFLTIKISG